MQKFNTIVWQTSSILLLYLTTANLSQAEVTPDGTTATQVVPSVDESGNSQFRIENGNFSKDGKNLFHSFREFSVPTNGKAIFDNPETVQNIFSRVTGGSQSLIDGLIKANGSANLFFINPNGIIFGPNAQLNIGGSFIATTADRINFSDGSFFSATDHQTLPILTVSIPVGLQFRETPGSIVNKSQFRILRDGSVSAGLQVPSGKTLALVGGNITLSDGGVLQAVNGRIELGSVANPGQVDLHPIKEGWTLSYERVQNFQDIKLTQGSLVSVFDLTGQTIQPGGNIHIRGRQLFITDASQILGIGANILVTASDTVEITGNTKLPPRPDGIVRIRFSGIGNEPVDNTDEGQTVINARRLIISNGGRIQTSSDGVIDSSDQLTIATGNAGNISINATESVELIGSPGVPTGLFSRTQSLRNAGNININTRNLVVQNGAQISAESSGRTFFGEAIQTGKGGNININATEFVQLDKGGIISAESLEMGKDAGNIAIETNDLNLNQGTITTQTNSEVGNPEGANISLQVADSIKLQNESDITANSTGTANGGNITIDTRFLIAYPPEGFNGNDITANSRGGVGGKIDITAKGVLGTQIRANLTIDNDIAAFSQLNPNLNVVINFDPNRGLVQFPTVVINPTTLINQDPCIAQDESQLVISRRGGLPPSIIEPISDRAIEVELVKPVNRPETSPQNRTNKPKSTTQAPIIPARGWVYNEYGEIVLTAYDPTAKAPQREQNKENVCPVQ